MNFCNLSGQFWRRSFRAIWYRVEPGYNDIGLHDTSPTESDIPCYVLINTSLVTITLDSSVITTQIFCSFHDIVTEFDLINFKHQQVAYIKKNVYISLYFTYFNQDATCCDSNILTPQIASYFIHF
jgi:hypothetical protein